MSEPSERTLWLQAVDAANDAGTVDVYALAVAVKMGRNMSQHGERCSPSVPGLAKRIGCSVRKARDAVRDLEAAGFVLTVPQGAENGRNLYVPALGGVPIVPAGRPNGANGSTAGPAPTPARRAAPTPAPGAAQTDVPPAPGAAPRHEVPPEQVFARHQVPRTPAPGAAEPSPRTLYVEPFSSRTHARGAAPVDNPARPAAPDGQGSLWIQPVEAPATPAEGSPSHPLAARAATVPRRRGGNAAGKPCECGHLVKDHAGSRAGFACTACDCRRYVAVPLRLRQPGAAATG